jgi:hypothetical protein
VLGAEIAKNITTTAIDAAAFRNHSLEATRFSLPMSFHAFSVVDSAESRGSLSANFH